MSIVSFATAIGAPVGIVSASFSFEFSICTGVVKKILKIRNENKKHNKTVMWARSKLNSIELKYLKQ